MQEKEQTWHARPPDNIFPSKTRKQKTEDALCSVSTGACPSVSRKDKVVEASIAHHRAVLSEHGAVVNYKIREIQANHDSTDMLLHMGSCSADMGAWSTNEDKLHLMKKERRMDTGPCPMDTGPCPSFCSAYK
ncbi:hypothetical protein HanHA300_Chr03g0081621 [Helianthus annuus]|nr:hypothetical protein HanHA300_Chr03g0081621 [Helianthus annuus]KAJ0607141.1 hypothetical protein HanHA89_Chr03g0093071 [Helianthus annuus]KAJ0767195.1 hypothetical protein HanLR1_Chr03g0086301 [Helianthus annuus]KAJ0773046.1 hypothetical protein HanOQP8_Chr03g0094391 [Helianthus annuus]